MSSCRSDRADQPRERVLAARLGATALIAAVVGWAALAWAHGGETHGGPRHKVTAEEKAAYEAAKPVFHKHCARCHTASGKKAKPKSLKHFSMDRYPFGGHHAGDIATAVRDTLVGKNGEAPTMPDDDPGAVKGEELKKILDWAAAFDRAQPPKPSAPAKPTGAVSAPHKH